MHRTRVKICGITSPAQAREIAALNVDALGFILYPPSPRYIEPEQIKIILADLPPFLTKVGVFVNEPLDKLIETIRAAGLDLAQLSGDESPGYCSALSKNGISWIKAFRVGEKFDEAEFDRYPQNFFLLDAWSKDEYGGTGKTCDWKLAHRASQKFQVILAGGLEVDNIQQAIEQVQPYGIDVSSGVETAPGIKSIEKIREMLARI